MKFSDFGLKEEIDSALEKIGFETPTEIQEKAIPLLLQDKQRDFVGLAQTGTGKTAAFGIPVLQECPLDRKLPFGLILSPTRELCLQITEELKRFGRNLKGLHITPVYGGANITTQIRSLSRGSQIVVATPGRLLDLIRRNRINISQVEHVVLDEADIMLNMGFKDELDGILQETPEEKRVILFSATMPPEVSRIASDYMKAPVEVTVGKKNAGSDDVEHSFVMVHSKDKYQALKRLLDVHPNIYGIVFCRTKVMTQQIADNLIKDGYDAESLHGDHSQTQRDLVMKKFRNRDLQILVATDVASRGLDVNNLTHVIHYDLPDDPENYIHRSGRTGRAGRKGSSIAVINMRERGRIRNIERMLKSKIDQKPVPAGDEICARQLIHLIDRVHAVEVDEETIAPHMPIIEEKLASLDREELLKRFVSMEFHRFMDYYKDARDINPTEPRARSGRDGGGRQQGSWQEIRLNIGRKDKVSPPDIINLINRFSEVRNVPLGNIDIHQEWSFVEVETQFAPMVAAGLQKANFQGKEIRPQFSKGKPGGSGRGGSSYRGGKKNYSGGKKKGNRRVSNASTKRGKY